MKKLSVKRRKFQKHNELEKKKKKNRSRLQFENSKKIQAEYLLKYQYRSIELFYPIKVLCR